MQKPFSREINRVNERLSSTDSNAHPHKDWLSIALDLGYYDYQHLVRDFKAFTGFTPTAFYFQETKAPERHFGIRET